jgi:hypothetical protein
MARKAHDDAFKNCLFVLLALIVYVLIMIKIMIF